MKQLATPSVWVAAASAAYAATVWLWLAFFREFTLFEDSHMIAHLFLSSLLLGGTVGLAMHEGEGSEGASAISYVLAVSIAAGCVMIIRTYRRFVCGPRFVEQNLSGKVYVVTGANSGIGRETAKALVRMGGHVVLACRNVEAAKKEQKAIAAELACNKEQLMTVMKLDLGSLSSVRTFVEDFKAKNLALDVLICNAGVMLDKAQDSEDGYEMHFAVNHLGHFLLVNELLPLLESSSDGRVVLVGSSLHYFATELDFDDLMTSKNYHMFRAYSRSKLAVMMYALELQNRLAQGSSCKTLVAVANPGLVLTSISKGMAWYMRLGDAIAFPILNLLRKQAYQGAYTLVHTATSPDMRPLGDGGTHRYHARYYTNCAVQVHNPAADDEVARRRLWDVSEAFVNDKKTK